MTGRIVVTINSTGRQAASFIRVASAVGWHVRAQVRSKDGLVAEELAALPNVTLFEGPLEQTGLIEDLFQGAELAFINTTHWGDEVCVGRAIADVAKRSRIKHFIYSSMPDHSIYSSDWKALPLWANKFTIENYVRQIGLPATFIYCGIYNNNFTSLPYPLFRMELQPDRKSFVWKAPFSPDEPLPWLDAEHDVGPAILQIFKQGVRRWGGHRIPLAFEKLTPTEVCALFSRALSLPVTYQRGPIDILVPVPPGYREHLDILEETLGQKGAPYFGPELDRPSYPAEAVDLWQGCRGIEEYAREVFPVEEAANGLRWMEDGAGVEEGKGEEDWGRGEELGEGGSGEGRPVTPGEVDGSARMGTKGTESQGFFVGNC
ncbi:NmrA-domain-containing protein [Viridothelium virens]|uniref:NmrA-domain-containing protein n=1 Tax=Viridothelium virens TaxID=1048519 RepID=A0A6A6H2S3_VIRVR|nr:NmrA-domain-containing protein [Viridothelium virens]